jgi:hypothetical protein
VAEVGIGSGSEVEHAAETVTQVFMGGAWGAVVTLHQMDRLCFVVVQQETEDMEGAHYRNMKCAREAIESVPWPGEAKVLKAPCWFIICDHCEEELEDDDSERGLHFESAEDALKYALAHDWTTDGHRFWCADCSGDGPQPEFIPVIAGQLVLDSALLPKTLETP